VIFQQICQLANCEDASAIAESALDLLTTSVDAFVASDKFLANIKDRLAAGSYNIDPTAGKERTDRARTMDVDLPTCPTTPRPGCSPISHRAARNVTTGTSTSAWDLRPMPLRLDLEIGTLIGNNPFASKTVWERLPAEGLPTIGIRNILLQRPVATRN